MTYLPTNWQDETPTSYPIKYKITDDLLGSLTDSSQIEIVTPVTAGTALNSTNLNKIETELVALDREFNVATGHGHDGIDSPKIVYTNLSLLPTLGNLAARSAYNQIVSLPVASWVAASQNVAVAHMTAAVSTIVFFGPNPLISGNRTAYYEADIYLIEQLAGYLKFGYTGATPTVAISVNVWFIV